MECNCKVVAAFEKMKSYSQEFVEKRDWIAFHTPKNIAMGISVEAAELLELFQWLTEEQSYKVKFDAKQMGKIRDEVGDIFHLLIRLSTLLDFDLVESFWSKLKKTELKYPVELAKGKAKKYSLLSEE